MDLLDQMAMSIEQTGEALGGLGKTSIYGLIRRKKLRVVKIGRRTLVTVESVRQLVAASDGGE
jgi:hypothetical protein